jgi:hypothetical protein
MNKADNNMRNKFLIFFSLIAIATVSSILNSWILQYQFQGGIDLIRAALQVCLIVMIPYTLWRYRSIPAYILALGYTIVVSLIHGDELISYFILGTISAKLPMIFVIISLLLIGTTVAAIILFGLDYVDYRNRRQSS